jgi:predicted alpha/beta superfamily hydrolase
MKFIGLLLCAAAILSLSSLIGFGKSNTNSHVRKEYERFESVNLPNTQVRRLFSENTKQAYRIYVSLPAGYYDEPNKKFPSVFVLDADYAFPLAKQISEHLSDRGRISETLIFGIAYDGPLNYRVNRTRDYTPTHVPGSGYGAEFQKHSGGGKAFADFLEKELIPYLSKQFRLDKKQVLVGHSFGGLLAAWIMLTRPHVFNGYIAVSPLLWYDQGLVLKILEGFNKTEAKIDARVFFAIGATENGGLYRMVDDMKRFVGLLPGKMGTGLVLNSVVFSDENHDTVFPAALTRGLGFVLGGTDL